LDFEYYCEKLCVEENKTLYVYAGGVFNSDSTLKGEGNIVVPDSCYKIILILDENQGVEDINMQTKIITVLIPNINGIRKDKWEKYVTTVRNIEELTGYDFFSNLSEELQEILENKKF
jgi:endonuclease G